MVRACCLLKEAGFRRARVSDSSSVLGEEASADAAILRGPAGARGARAEAGETLRAIAAALSISPSCVSKWRRLLRETGALTPGRVGGHKPRTLNGENADWLRARVAEGAFATRGLVAEMAARGVKTDRRAVWVFLRAEGLGFKKNGAAGRTGPAAHRPDAGALESAPGPR